jgi:REP element-mobilizing transposase RayT
MAYPLRLHFDGAIYHVTARGDNRELTFRDDEDRARYLTLLARYKTQLQFRLYAYALMPNHIHLILEPSSAATVSRVMQCQTIAYTKWFNKRHSRVGHVFQGRFHSRLIEKESYLLVASRYVHRNPVRAKLARAPGDYPWSSYWAYAIPNADPLKLVDCDVILGLMGGDAARQRTDYREFVEASFPRDAASVESWLRDEIAGTKQFTNTIRERFGLAPPVRRRRPRSVSDIAPSVSDIAP